MHDIAAECTTTLNIRIMQTLGVLITRLIYDKLIYHMYYLNLFDLKDMRTFIFQEMTLK